MSRIRVVAARLYAAFIMHKLFVMSCRSKLTKYLLLIPMMLLPKAVLADGDLPIWFAMLVKVLKQHSHHQSLLRSSSA
ncbi:hypothetical protein LQQ76_26275 (plasmid) [Escherichia coli]|nr:hypothetical protein LQQ76_26275 [Escherichia coli]